jgi:hypothetical protein
VLVPGGAEAVGDELQVLLQVFLRPRHADELHDAVRGVVPNSPIGFEQRDDAVVVQKLVAEIDPECVLLVGESMENIVRPSSENARSRVQWLPPVGSRATITSGLPTIRDYRQHRSSQARFRLLIS